MSKIVFPNLILYKVESVRNKDLNLKELQQLLIIIFLIINCIVVSLFSKTVRQEAREKESKPFADLNLNARRSSFSRNSR